MSPKEDTLDKTDDETRLASSPEARDVMARIVQESREAESLDDLLGGVTDIDDLIGIPIQIRDVDWQESDVKGSPVSHYAVIHAVDASGAQVVTTCGGERIVAQLQRAQEKAWLPFACVIRRADTDAGFRTYFLAKAPVAR